MAQDICKKGRRVWIKSGQICKNNGYKKHGIILFEKFGLPTWIYLAFHLLVK